MITTHALHADPRVSADPRVRLRAVIRRVPAFDDEQACPFVQGDVYQRKLPGLSGRPSFRVTMPPIRQKLGDVTHRQVIAEGRMDGKRALERWRIEWVKQHDGWAKRPPHRTASDAEILIRWRTVHATRYCWVLTIALLDPVRCMAAQEDILSGRTMRGLSSDLSDQYVASGGIDQYAEAVDEATQARIVAGELKARMDARLSRTERRQARRVRLFEGGEA